MLQKDSKICQVDEEIEQRAEIDGRLELAQEEINLLRRHLEAEKGRRRAAEEVAARFRKEQKRERRKSSIMSMEKVYF